MTRNSSIAKSHVTKDLHGKTHYRQNVIIATQTRKNPVFTGLARLHFQLAPSMGTCRQVECF